MWHTNILSITTLNHDNAEIGVITEGITYFAGYFLTWSNLLSSFRSKIQVGTQEQPGRGVSAYSTISLSCRLRSSSQHLCGCEYFETLCLALQWQGSPFCFIQVTQWVLYSCPCPAGWGSISRSVVCQSRALGVSSWQQRHMKGRRTCFMIPLYQLVRVIHPIASYLNLFWFLQNTFTESSEKAEVCSVFY